MTSEILPLARRAADRLTGQLVRVPPAAADPRLVPQSLVRGAAAIALLAVEQAASGRGSWDSAHAWLAAAIHGGVDTGRHATLFYGAPTLAFTFHGAAHPSGRYERALETLDAATATVTRERLDTAHARIDRGERPALAEFDLIYGLTGLGVHQLRRDPGGQLLRDVLAYLVRLTEPVVDDLPGWWTDLGPSGEPSPHFPGGHGNFGMAHGISGPLALLALAMQRGIVVPGQAEAMTRICAWLDSWRQEGEIGSWWPEWITRGDAERQHPTQRGPYRPSWCYGTPGLARAQQLAALATGDTQRQEMAEQAMRGCLTDSVQLARITEGGLCHGAAGLFQTAWRMAADARTTDLAGHLPGLATRLLATAAESGLGLLDGSAGLALALHTAAGPPPASRWDAGLLL